jgi:hypothetical protein
LRERIKGIAGTGAFRRLWDIIMFGLTVQRLQRNFYAEIPEARYELEVYVWWWETQGRPDLAAKSQAALDIRRFIISFLTTPTL